VADLSKFDGVEEANWETFLGINMAAGSVNVSNTPWTAADVGKVAVVLLDSVTQEWFVSTITAVAEDGSAELADEAPATVSDARCRYGFDGTTALQAALDAVEATTDGPTEAYLGGNYRVSQLVIPAHVVLHGLSWYPNTGRQVGSGGNTVITQLPGTEDDLIIFGVDATFGDSNYLAFNGLTDLDLWGPEKDVSGLDTPSTGSGVNLRVVGSTWGVPIDGFTLERVKVSEFPESGFVCHGATPLYVDECKAFSNGEYGFNHEPHGDSPTNALNILNFSGDWNNKGVLGFHNMGPNDSIFITGLKSECGVASAAADLNGYGSPYYQSTCVVFDQLDDTVVTVEGISHSRIKSAGTGPGPVLDIRDYHSYNKTPRLTFSGVTCRVDGDETPGTTDNAVTLRDHILNNKDLPRTVTSGYYNQVPYVESDSGLEARVATLESQAVSHQNSLDRIDLELQTININWSNQKTWILNFANIQPQTSETVERDFSGAMLQDVCCVTISNSMGVSAPELVFFSWVSAADKVSIRAYNVGDQAVDPSGQYVSVRIIR